MALVEKMGKESYFESLLPFAGLVVGQCLYTGLSVISKAALSQGMSIFVFVAYSSALGLLPLFLSHPFLQRTGRPPITLSLLGKCFVIGLTAMTVVKNFIFVGINFSSPTLWSAMSNLDTALTFILAVIFRMEKVNIRCVRSQIKILGTFVSISGAIVMTFYKGPALWASIQSNTLDGPVLPQLMQPVASNWVFGGFCFLVVAFSSAASNILQASVLKDNPSEITMVLFYHLFGTVQCSVISLIVIRDPNAWKLKPDMELAAILFSAFGGTAASYITAWSIRIKGPVYVALFSPMGVVIAALMSAIFLGDTLYVGSVVGAIIIITGFYGVVWAKSKENDEEYYSGQLPSSSSKKTPLLEH